MTSNERRAITIMVAALKAVRYQGTASDGHVIAKDALAAAGRAMAVGGHNAEWQGAQ